MRMRSKLLLSSGLLSVSSVLFLAPAQAFGPKPPKPGPSYTLPDPVRHVIVRPFQDVHEFEAPNGVTTTLQQAQTVLTDDLEEAATQAGLSVVQGGNIGDMDPCGEHLEIQPVVTDFTMDAMSANIQFGFNNTTGTINVAEPTAVAQDTITLGSIKFALFLDECGNTPGSSCQTLLAADADQTVLGNHAQFTISYQSLSAGADIFNKTDLGKAVLSILDSGIHKIVSNAAMAQVPWSSVVAAVNQDGSITMMAGSNLDAGGIGPNQYFTVYQRANATSACGAFQALDCVATTEVNGPSSVATVYRKLDLGASIPIEPGDVVYVGSPACALKQ